MSNPNLNLEVEFNKLNLNETLKDTSVNTVSSVDKMCIGSKSETYAESTSNDKVEDQELENFAEKLDIKQFAKSIDEIKKFY
ncbi:1716_t:CDS:1, partial [Funneliformis mosseae]